MALPQAQQPAVFEEYVGASSLEEALRALADGEATPVAGGTDLWVQKDLGVRPVARRLINIRRVPEIAGISKDGNRIRLGALVTMTEILESELLQVSIKYLKRALVSDALPKPVWRSLSTVSTSRTSPSR